MTEPGAEKSGRVVRIGWLLDVNQAALIYEEPRPLRHKAEKPASSKALTNCPAVQNVEARYYEILCPFDLRIALRQGPQGGLGLQDASGPQSAFSPQIFPQVVQLLDQARWRDPQRPVMRIVTPYRFVADEPVWLEQMAPFNAMTDKALPGVFVGRRLPIDIWPQLLSWTFEWQDLNQEVVLKRGQPWFYLTFETNDPERPIRLVEAEMTEDLKAHCTGLDQAERYTSRDLFEVARARRPKTLLKPLAD